MTDTCPTWPTLLAWLENDLPDEESQLLNTHVADCPVCREKLAVMNAVQDVGECRAVDFDFRRPPVRLCLFPSTSRDSKYPPTGGVAVGGLFLRRGTACEHGLRASGCARILKDTM